MDSVKRGSQEPAGRLLLSEVRLCSVEGDKIINDLRNRLLVFLNKLLVAYRRFSSYHSVHTVNFTLSYLPIHLLHYQEGRQNSAQGGANYLYEMCSVNYQC
jgi:hypothetical protein